MSKPFEEIKKIHGAIQKANISRDELASLDEEELQEILRLTLFIEGWSSTISRVIDESATASPSFLKRIIKLFNETTTFQSWCKEASEMDLKELYKAKEALIKSISDIDSMLDFVERVIEGREAINRFWENRESDH